MQFYFNEKLGLCSKNATKCLKNAENTKFAKTEINPKKQNKVIFKDEKFNRTWMNIKKDL